MLRGQKDTFEVHIDHALPHFFVEVDDRSVPAIRQIDGRVAVEHVEAAKGVDGALDHHRNVAPVGHGADDRNARTAGVGDEQRGLREAFFVDVAHGHARPSRANSTAAARPMPLAAPVMSATLLFSPSVPYCADR